LRMDTNDVQLELIGEIARLFERAAIRLDER
jgi:hypothetical protein